MFFKKFFPITLVLLVLLAFWEGSSRFFPTLLFILPAPSKVFSNLWVMRQNFCIHSLATIKEMGGGFLLALATSFPLAWIMLRHKATNALLQPFFILIQCLPMFTLAPLMVVWFGWGYLAILIPTALMIFFPLTMSIYQGLRMAPQEFVEFFQLQESTPWQLFFKLRLPWAASHIFAGLRISSAIAGVGAVAGEWAGAEKGLGILMLESRRNTDLEITFGALFCLTTISFLLYGSILFLEKTLLPLRLGRLPLLEKKAYKKSKLPGKRLALTLVIGAALLAMLGSCQKNNASPKETRLLLDWLPNPNHIPIYVGLDKGFFDEFGISLKIQKMHENGGGISFLTSRQADLLVNHMPDTFKACSKGAKLKITGLIIDKPLSGFIYRKNLKIQNPKDLTGHVLGYCLGGQDTSFLDFLLQKGSIYPSTRKNVSVDLISAIGTHSVDFIYGGFWNIEPAQLKSLGVETDWFKVEDLGIPPYYELIILANEGSKEASASFALNFGKALQKSLDFCKKFPEVAFLSYQKQNKDKSHKTLAWEKKAWYATIPLLADSQTLDQEILSSFYSWLLEEELLSSTFDPLALIP